MVKLNDLFVTNHKVFYAISQMTLYITASTRCNFSGKGKGRIMGNAPPKTIPVAVSLARSAPHSVFFRVLLSQLPIYLHINSA